MATRKLLQSSSAFDSLLSSKVLSHIKARREPIDMPPDRQGGGSGSRIASLDDRPLSGIFGINKPSGPLSMVLLDDIKELFAYSSLFKNPDGSLPAENGGRGWRGGKRKTGLSKAERKKNAPPKIGQGGTLDPLADGVLVVGVGRGTKQLQRFLDCTKEYRSTGLLGTATTSYDCKDPILLRAPFQHVSRETILEALPRFRGDLKQLPPLFSAIKMDGKRLFDYAREGSELPRPIEPRSVRVEQLELVEWHPAGSHAWVEPVEECGEEEKKLVGRVRRLAGLDPSAPGTDDAALSGQNGASSSLIVEKEDETGPTPEKASSGPPAFTIDMTVTSGTYVRSIVHDLAQSVGSAAHVVRLTRNRQGEFSIGTLGSKADVTAGVTRDAFSDSLRDDNRAERQHAGTGADRAGEVKNGDIAEQDKAAKTSKDVALPGNCIEWHVFEKALKEFEEDTVERDEQGLAEWERILLSRIQPC
ncbi:pseudouridine synthase [Ceraceosorus guamensis]|uniref:tRNA pseudouridine(55) synthase n=1 Tax=Ceraceosorus guamensis TaxID=1522189 RepID=A0A316W7U7_9BASI|nr:pseudouridine synthase [Ceraceosorus guamensis]PWN45939.1 pseudouridine synthase [Ceraceosorus guamensis]